jgi:hypothetical protein
VLRGKIRSGKITGPAQNYPALSMVFVAFEVFKSTESEADPLSYNYYAKVQIYTTIGCLICTTSVFLRIASLSLRSSRQTEGARTMDTTPGEKPPPESTNLEGWRQAIADGRLPAFRLEVIVAAFQDLGPTTDKKVRNALAKHLSDSMIGMLRRAVGPNRPNNGEDIIYRVHFQLFEALLQPGSADGKGLRLAFGPRVMFRVKDAIAVEFRHARIPMHGEIKKSNRPKKPDDTNVDEVERLVRRPEPSDSVENADSSNGEEAASHNSNRDLTLLHGVRDADEEIDVESVLANVTDYRKRLAFRLYMDDVPFKSKKANSIAKALGISDKTAEHWIGEVQELLKTKVGDKI